MSHDHPKVFLVVGRQNNNDIVPLLQQTIDALTEADIAYDILDDEKPDFHGILMGVGDPPTLHHTLHSIEPERGIILVAAPPGRRERFQPPPELEKLEIVRITCRRNADSLTLKKQLPQPRYPKPRNTRHPNHFTSKGFRHG